MKFILEEAVTCHHCHKPLKSEPATHVMVNDEWKPCCSQSCARKVKGVRLQKVGDEVWEMSW